MNKIVATSQARSAAEAQSPVDEKITVLNPVGYPPNKQEGRGAAAGEPGRQNHLPGRLPLRQLGRAVERGTELVRRAHARGEERMISLSNTYQHDDPKTWEEIKANGDAAIVGVGHCQQLLTGGGHPRDHAGDALRRSDGCAPHRQVRPRRAVSDQDGRDA